jgi:hypothetical protein
MTTSNTTSSWVQNFLSKTGIKFNYSEGNMEWFNCSIPLRPTGGLDLKEFDAMEDCNRPLGPP